MNTFFGVTALTFVLIIVAVIWGVAALWALEETLDDREGEQLTGNWEQDYPKDHHYALLLECGHYKHLRPNWNIIIDGGSDNPKEAYCHLCDIATLVNVVGFAKMEHDAS